MPDAMQTTATKITVITIVIIQLLLVSCGQPSKSGQQIGWPLPPSEPRIIYRDVITGTQDLTRSFWGKMKDFFLGKAENQGIGKPYGVCLADGKIYLADTSKKGITLIDLEAGVIKFFNSLGAHGTLQEPVYVALDHENNIYVSDTKLGKIAVFDSRHRFLYFIGDYGELTGPVGIVFDRSGERLFVVDTQEHMVKIFSRQGELLGQFGRRGDEQGEFYFPLTATISRGDTLYIVDSFHFAIQAFDLDGNYLFTFGPNPAGGSSLQRPRDIAMDSDNHLYITDAISNSVKIFDTQGRSLLVFGNEGAGAGQFRLPAGIAIDKNNMIYIADSMNGRIQKFEYISNSQEKL